MHYPEWSYVEDDKGIIFSIGRRRTGDTYEGIAAYLRSPDNSGYKSRLDGTASYSRLMYHGLPEEDALLQSLPVEVRQRLSQYWDKDDATLLINPDKFKVFDKKNRQVSTWLNLDVQKVFEFQKSLKIAYSTLDTFNISQEKTELYGGIAAGLVDRNSKQVDDIDLLLTCSSSELYDYARHFQQKFSWEEIDPVAKLSPRRRLLKAKRWSTSQIRLTDPYQLSIDLKIPRLINSTSLWDGLPLEKNYQPFTGKLEVIDDSEIFCISPALLCRDENGKDRTVLMSGYPYIGCAVKGDLIELAGDEIVGTSFILVTQRSEHTIIPDMRDVPVS